MSENDTLLLEAPLVPDPDAEQELGPSDAEAIADEDLKGSRLLLVRRAIEAIHVDGVPGGAIEFACTFQPAPGTRFTWARLLLRLLTPTGVHIVDLAPREVREAEPVRFTVSREGKLGLNYAMVEASADASVRKEFTIYHCAIQGSGERTALARWDFNENPHRQDGLGREQSLALTLPVTGPVAGTVSVSARLARGGVRGALEAIRDVILGPDERQYPIAFEIPQASPLAGLTRFLRLS